jgi:hypothetical protein
MNKKFILSFQKQDTKKMIVQKSSVQESIQKRKNTRKAQKVKKKIVFLKINNKVF